MKKIGMAKKLGFIINSVAHGVKPKKYSCRFMTPGLTNYPGDDDSKKEEMWYIGREVMNAMLPGFVGCPIVREDMHDDRSIPENFEKVAVGVITNTYTQDGWDCADFIVWDDKTKQECDSGYNVSCAYEPLATVDGGVLNSIKYDKEVTQAEYMHMAIVKNPRQTGSKILFNSVRESMVFNNLWKGEMTMFKLWPTGKLRLNSEDKPEDKKEEKEEKAEEKKEEKSKENAEEKKDEPTAINADEAIVETPDGDVSLADLVNSYQTAKKNAEDEEAKKNAEGKEEDKEKLNAEPKKLNMDDEFDGIKVSAMYDAYKASKKNAEDDKEKVNADDKEEKKEDKKEEKEERKENADDKEKTEEKEKLNHFNSLKDARDKLETESAKKVVLTKRERAKINSVVKEY